MNEFLKHFGIKPEAFAQVAVQIVLIWSLALGFWQIVKSVAKRVVASADDGDDTTFSLHEKRAATIAQLLRSVGRVIIVLLATMLTLNQFFDITALLAGAGILGLAISFGAQSVFKDLIAGCFILIENQFVVGDVIEAVGKTGTVERMTLRVVMLRDVEGAVHIIPNGQIVTVTNKTRGWGRAVLDIGIGYDTDLDAALETLRDEAKHFAEEPLWAHLLDGPPEVLGVEKLGENAVTIRVQIRTQPGKQWEVGREFRRRAKVRLDLEGIEIPFPQRTVHVRHHGAPPGDPTDVAAQQKIADDIAAAGGA